MVVFIGQYAQPKAKSRSFFDAPGRRRGLHTLSYQSRLPDKNEVPQQQGSWPLHLHHLAPPVFSSAFSMRGSHVWPF